MLVKNFECLHNLTEINDRPLFGKETFFLNQFIQSTTIAIIINKIEIVRSLKHIDIVDNILRLVSELS